MPVFRIIVIPVITQTTLTQPGGAHPRTRGTRIVPAQITIKGVYETSHYRLSIQDRQFIASGCVCQMTDRTLGQDRTLDKYTMAMLTTHIDLLQCSADCRVAWAIEARV